MVQSCVATCAQATAAVGIVGVAFDFDNAVVFDVTNDAANGAAQLTHAGNFFGADVFVFVWPVTFCLRTGQLANAGRFLRTQRIGFAFEPSPLLHIDALLGTRAFGRIRIIAGVAVTAQSG